MVSDVKILSLILALPFVVALAVAAHALASRLIKAVLWAWSPLAIGEPEAFSYERRVYHTADAAMLQIIGLAAAAGFAAWAGLVLDSVWAALVAAPLFVGALVLDVQRWERVAASGSALWFQRGFFAKVHQIDAENIRDITVEEAEAGGFTLRHGFHNRIARLKVRMSDKRVAALPKTDAARGLDSLEAVANHVRLRMEHLRHRRAMKMSSQEASAAAAAAAQAPKSDDDDLRRTLRQLRRGALAPTVPPAVSSARAPKPEPEPDAPAG